jgi:hypothetical protein
MIATTLVLHVERKEAINRACQEKYLREFSVTPAEYFTGAKSIMWAWGVMA